MAHGTRESFVLDYLSGFAKAMTQIDPQAVATVIAALEQAERRRRTVFLAGNGGSASTANHIACDLSRRFPDYHPGFRVVSLAANEAVITSWGNDVGFDSIFSSQLAGWIEKGDILLVVSVSGDSPNVLSAMRAARKAGGVVVALLGKDGGKARKLADHCVVVPSRDYGFVETAHLFLDHLFAAYFSNRDSGRQGR